MIPILLRLLKHSLGCWSYQPYPAVDQELDHVNPAMFRRALQSRAAAIPSSRCVDVSFAANPSADPRNNLGQTWPKFTGPSGQIVVFGNATGPGASYIAPVAVADKYSGPC